MKTFDGVLFARISDNVLDRDDWPVFQLTVRGGFVSVVIDVKPGVYNRPHLSGRTLRGLADWSRFDATGQHPEEYHELAVALPDKATPGHFIPGRFEDFWTADQLEEALR